MMHASSRADLQHSNGTNSLIFNGTNSLISNMMNASSGADLGADLQHFNGTNSLISNMINASSGAFLGADLQHFNRTNSLISNMINATSGAFLGADLQHFNRTNSLISNMINATSGAFLGADLQHFNRTNPPISNTINASSGALLAADWQHSLLVAVVALGLAGTAVSLALSLLSLRTKPLPPSSLLLLQLALLDALFLATLPLHIHSQLRGHAWSSGEAACRFSRVLFRLHGPLSVALLGSLAGAAWLRALRPLSAARLRGRHFALLALALWVLALGASVPPVLRETEPGSCSGSSAEGWSALGFIFEAVVPLAVTVLGLPLAAGSVWRRGRRAGRRRALGTIGTALGICALCFVPGQLSQALRLLGLWQEPFPSLVPLSRLLGACSCCLNPLLFVFRSSGPPWRCPCSLRLRTQRVFTICDRNFGDPSWDYEAGQRRGKENPRGWKRLMGSKYTQS